MPVGVSSSTRQLEFLVGKRSSGPTTFSLGDALGIAQHHDAVTGTAKQHTTDDYAKRLSIGASESESVVSSALSCLTSTGSRDQCAKPTTKFSQCPLLNISYCPPTEEDISNGKNLVIVAYNPIGWKRTDFIRIPVKDNNLVVKDSSGNVIDSQFVPMDGVTSNLRKFYTAAYLGHSSNQVPKYWLLFQASLPPLGWNTYFISKATNKVERSKGYLSAMDSPQNDDIEVGPGNLKMNFSGTTGQLKRMHNTRTGVEVAVQQSFLWYGSSTDDQQPSNAYIFRPNGAPPNMVSRSVQVRVVRGPLVDEVHQQFSSWIYQVYQYFFTVGPIPTNDSVGKEVISQITANMVTDKTFYTDSNGRDFLKRVRDYRADWNLSVNQPLAGNYYPLNLGIYTKDKKSELSVLVDRATGGASIKDGQVELMLHRRLLDDDVPVVGEALDEMVCVGGKCEGLTVRGNYYLSINELGAGARWRRTTGQEIYSPILLAFTHEKIETWKASNLTKATVMDSNYSLPLNVALITLQELDDGSVLLRLAHLYEINELKEMSLSTNQEKSEMKKMKWKIEGDNGQTHSPIKGGLVDSSVLVVELGPMEIRTFLLKF
ncbi:hypothetical protein Pint_28469 [Pistacia integerrima]|uniref:Uncharacterized protein n=1 Tax=Pistacia integerrima TaxID=434235 RepID=A0ACC0YSJ0_9ROSI|nr:hypothetical protein Pint_28469 [Pistacia integerrima]